MSTDPTGARVEPAPAGTAEEGDWAPGEGVDPSPDHRVDDGGTVEPTSGPTTGPRAEPGAEPDPEADDEAGLGAAGRRRRTRDETESERPAVLDRIGSVLDRAAAVAPRPSSPPANGRKVRRVHRVIRHVEVWSVFKVTATLAACGYVMVLVSGYLLWRAADRVGTLDGVEGFLEDAGGYDRYELLGGTVFRVAAVGGIVVAAGFVAMAVLGTVLFNLISDITGGIRMTVIDEDLVVVPTRARRGAGAEPPGPSPG